MRKRLRKKLHLKEFKELGFVISFNGPSLAFVDKFLDNFFYFIEIRKLESGGVWNTGYGNFYISKYRNSATDEDRIAINDWLVKQNDLSNIKVDNLSDAWYGPI